MDRTNCPTEEQLEQFLNGTLPDPPASDVEAHWQSCSLCEGTVIELEVANETFIQPFKRTIAGQLGVGDDPALQRALQRIHAMGPFPETISTDESTGHERGRPSHRVAMPQSGPFGAYDLLEQIGRGGMGTVFRARHRRLDQQVAIKIVPGGQIQDPEVIARFDREMRAVGRLKHPNLVQAQDAGETDGNEFLYLVMELLDGVNAATILQRGRVPVADACEIARQAALALQYVHAQRQVHRDVKPSNLMVTTDGTVKLLDLGLALLGDSPDHALTSAGQIMGTLDYMAPEQAGNSHEVDGRADVYSLGCTFFALLTGAAPFAGSEFGKIAQKILAHATIAPPSVKAQRPDLPDELSDLTSAMLHKDPARRPTMGQILDCLAKHCQGANLQALVASDGRSTQPACVEPQRTAFPPVARSAGTRRGWKFWTSIAAMLLIGGLGFGQVVIIIKNNGKKERVEIAANQIANVDGKTGKVVVTDAPRNNSWHSPTSTRSLPVMGSRALVAEPRMLPGVDTWTIETTAPRGQIISARFSPDGQRVAAWSQDGTLRVWDSTTSKLLGMFPAPPGFLNLHPMAFSFSPDGNQIALAAETMRVWEIGSGRMVWQLSAAERFEPTNDFRVAWSPDGRWIATDKRSPTGSYDRGGRNVQLWDAATGKSVRSLVVPAAEIAMERGTVVAWSPDSSQLAAVTAINHGRYSIDLFDVATGARLQSTPVAFDGGSTLVNQMEWSSDGDRIAITGNGGLLTWKVDEWRELDRAATGQEWRTGMRWLDKGSTLACGNVRHRYSDNQATVQANADLISDPSRSMILDWSPDGTRVLYYDYSSLTIVDAADTSKRHLITGTHNNNGFVPRHEWQSNDVYRFHGFAWNIRTGRRMEPVGALSTDDDKSVVAPSPDGKWLLIVPFGTDNTYHSPVLRRVDGTLPDRELVDEEEPIVPFGGNTRATWSGDSSKVCVAGVFCVRSWDAESGKLLGRIAGPREVAAFSPDGNSIFCAEQADYRVRAISGEPSADFPIDPVLNNVTSHNGYAIWTSDGNRLRVIQSAGRIIDWDAKTGKEIERGYFRISDFNFNNRLSTMSPDNRTLAIDGAYCVYLYSTDSLRSLGTIVHLGPNWLFVTPDGRVNGEYYPDEDVRYIVLRNSESQMINATQFQREFARHFEK